MNAVSRIGTLTDDPDLQEHPTRCTLRLAVPRYARNGQRLPGVVYIAVTRFGEEARDCAERLKLGSSVGLTGRLDSDDTSKSAGVLIDQLDYL
jgi:single-stranded DNA-binding protein